MRKCRVISRNGPVDGRQDCGKIGTHDVTRNQSRRMQMGWRRGGNAKIRREKGCATKERDDDGAKVDDICGVARENREK